MGETDVETMANVTIAKYDFDDEAFNDVSNEAKDFISKLLVKQISWVLHLLTLPFVMPISCHLNDVNGIFTLFLFIYFV